MTGDVAYGENLKAYALGIILNYSKCCPEDIFATMPEGTPITVPAIDAALQTFYQRVRSKNTLGAYRADLSVFRRFMQAKTVAEALCELVRLGPVEANERVEAFMVWKRASSKTINRRLSALRGVISAVGQVGIIDWPLWVKNKQVTPELKTKAPGIEAVKLILQRTAIEKSISGRRNYAMLRILAETGINRKELRSLNVSGFDDLHETLAIGRTRVVKISRTTANAIKAWLIVKPSGQKGALFENLMRGRAGRLTGSAILAIVKAAAGRAGVKAGPRVIRRTAIEQAISIADETNQTLEEVMAFSGHKNPVMLARYRSKKNFRKEAGKPTASLLVD